MFSNILFYIAAIMCIIMPIMRFVTQDKKRIKSEGNLSKKNYVIWMIIASAIAIVVRCYDFGNIPAGMNQDGAMAAVDANALAHYGTDRFGMSWPVHFTAWGYGQMSVLMSYMMIPFIRMFGLSAFSVRLPMLIGSLIGIALLYLIVRRLFGRRAALIALFLVAINPWHVMQSRWALDCNLFPHVVLMGIYLLIIGLQRKGFLYISMFFFGMSMYTYGIAIYAVPLMLLTICVYLIASRRIEIRQALICLLTYAFFAWPIFAMTIINAFSLSSIHIGPFTIPYFPNSIRTNDIIFFSDNALAQLLQNAKSFFSVVIKQDIIWNHNGIKEYGSIYLFAMPFVALGLAGLCTGISPKKEADTNARDGRVILLIWLLVAATIGLVFNGINVNRINIIYYPLIVLCALGINALMDLRMSKAIATAVALMFGVSFCGFTISYFGDHAEVLAKENSSEFADALAFAERQHPETIYVTAYSKTWYSPDSSEILLMFYNKIDATYYQGKSSGRGTDGTEWLPFNERYRMMDFGVQGVPENPNAAYILREYERDYFDATLYDLRDYGDFFVALPRS